MVLSVSKPLHTEGSVWKEPAGEVECHCGLGSFWGLQPMLGTSHSQGILHGAPHPHSLISSGLHDGLGPLLSGSRLRVLVLVWNPE